MILVLASVSALAIEIPKTLVVDGQTYNGVVYQWHNEFELHVMHEAGAATFDIATLPSDLKKSLGYSGLKYKIAKERYWEARAQITEAQRREAQIEEAQRRQAEEAQEDQTWVSHNLDKPDAKIGMGVLELKAGGDCSVTLVSAGSDPMQSSGTWTLNQDGENLSYQIKLQDGSDMVLTTQIGETKGVWVVDSDTVVVFERKK